jgi:hypothetical protein
MENGLLIAELPGFTVIYSVLFECVSCQILQPNPECGGTMKLSLIV